MMASVLLGALLLALCCEYSCVSGVRFRVNGGPFFTGSQNIDINDVVTTSGAGLICQSQMKITEATFGRGDWYLHPEDQTTTESNRIQTGSDRGWQRTRTTTSGNNKQVILRRQPASETVLEGRFTCEITGDNNPIRSLYVLYPISSVTVSIVVDSARDGEFRVQCSSTGGRALSMTVTGPDGYNSDLTDNIESMGTPDRIGDDDYRATTSDIITGGSDGDEYVCTATGSTSNTGSVQLRVASAPIIEPLERTAPGTVRVVWSQPTGGAPVTGYIIHYTKNGGSARVVTVIKDFNSTDITGLRNGKTYTISVQAMSEHLSGESETMTVTVEPPPAAPGGVMSVVNSTSVTVSWGTVTGADSYTVTFTRAKGTDQQGACSDYSHTTSINAQAITASIIVGRNVESTVTDMLSAFSTYFITVVAVNGGGPSEESDEISFMTLQTGAGLPPKRVMATVVSSTEISVQWNKINCIARNGNITSYKIRYTAQSTGMIQTIDQNEGLEITLTGLTPFTNYSIEVAAVNNMSDMGVYSEPMAAITKEDYPGQVGDIKPFPSFFMITIIWEEPDMPNGIIIHYEVVYRPKVPQQSTKMQDVTHTNFTTPEDLERGTEYTFTVTARTSVGPGKSTSINVFTLDRPRSVEGVRVVSLNDTSAMVSWDDLVIPGHPIDSYTVVYSPVSQEEEEMTAVFPGTVTSAVITGLDSSFNYQFQVFATVIVNGQTLEGERSSAEATARNIDRQGGGSDSSAGGVVAGVIVALIVVAAVVVTAVLLFLWMKRRGREKGISYKPSTQSSSYTTPPVHYSKTTNIDSNGTEPKITKFPEDKHALEGEKVVFKVRVTGSPQPKLRWYHDGEEVVADYSKELGDDGSLTMPSAETKHSGVYQLVASNKAGSMEREVKLTVDKEGGEEAADEPSYDTVALSGAIPVAIFGNHVEQKHSKNNKPFKDEYEGLPTSGNKTTEVAMSEDNKLKNRFANICVYDDNRVRLKPVEGHDSDYVNASYIDGYSTAGKFIATQGPLPKTVVDFWRLVWQERVPTIVMITNLVEGTKIKCQQYWPDAGAQTYGPFQVTISDQQILADYTTRSLLVQLKGSSERGLKVTQFHFTAWPDHGVPDYATPILAFHRRVMKEHRSGRIIVHCSAGVGRTGTLITIDRVLEQVAKEGEVDIPGTITMIRKQRTKMVQTMEQYIFIHDAVLEAVTCGDTQIVSGDLRSILSKLQRRDQSGKTELELQFSVLEQVSPNPRDAKVSVARKNPKKNRSSEFLPVDKWRVVMKGETPDYINASVAHGYKQQRAFIIAQSPMQSTARDFWKIVFDRNCGVIVMLCDLVEYKDEACFQYWPSSGSVSYGEFTVELLEQEDLSGFSIRTFGAVNSKTNKSHQMTQFQITNWAPNGSCENIKSVTDVIEEVGKAQRRSGNNPVIVHCSDTVSRSGMFCAIATTIERCKTEGVVDVFQVVKALRVQKPGAVRTVLQYRIIFEAVLEYLDSFALYSNF